MNHFEVRRPSGDGLCSDRQCPCPEDLIPRGTGFIYVSQELVDFRRDALSQEAMLAKLERERRQLESLYGGNVSMSSASANPILMCERGAKLRGLDLDVAAADAAYWWEKGFVPLHATPLTPEVAFRKHYLSGSNPDELKDSVLATSSPEEIHDILVIRYPKNLASQGQGQSLEEIVNTIKSGIPADAIDISPLEIMQEAGQGVLEIVAQTQAQAEAQFVKDIAATTISRTTECLVQPKNGFLGFGKKPGTWRFQWKKPFVARFKYLIPAIVLVRYRTQK